MASWMDYFALAVTLIVCSALAFVGFKVWQSISESVAVTKDKLKNKGYDVSSGGVAVKTNKRMNREDYVDATQRGIMKAMGAASIGSANSSPTVPRNGSVSQPLTSEEEKRKRGLRFGRRKDQ